MQFYRLCHCLSTYCMRRSNEIELIESDFAIADIFYELAEKLPSAHT